LLAVARQKLTLRIGSDRLAAETRFSRLAAIGDCHGLAADVREVLRRL
jgi:hypothetical protein